MRRLALHVAGAAALLACLAGAAIGADAPRALTVFAAASLTDAFTQLGARFERAHAGTRVEFDFAGSQLLAARLEQGAPADVFASADQRWMDYVTKRGLIDGEPATFARNQLVIIVPRTNPARIDRVQDLARPGIKLVLCAEAVPAGRYARQALRALGSPVVQGFPAGYPARALANLVSEEDNVRAVVGKVQLGEADAGIVYRSDVTPGVAAHVKVLELPAVANVIAEYPIAVLKGARAPEDAHAFVELVLSPEGQQVMRASGFMGRLAASADGDGVALILATGSREAAAASPR